MQVVQRDIQPFIQELRDMGRGVRSAVERQQMAVALQMFSSTGRR
jgi:hypothetical protein